MNNSAEINSCCCHNTLSQQDPVKPSKAKRTVRTLPSVVLSVLIAFFPKCPVCWAVYMSMFGSLGLARLPYMGWLLPVLLIFLGIHLFMLFRRRRQNGYIPFLLSLAGATVILCGRSFLPGEKWLLISGMVMIISGSLLNSFFHIRMRSFSYRNDPDTINI